MKSTRPYLIRAFYEWIADNKCTPYIVVDAEAKDVTVPLDYIEAGQIILNISMESVRDLSLGNKAISFEATFAGSSYSILAPIQAIKAIYAKENGRGMVFSDEEPPYDDDDSGKNKGTKGSGGKGSHLSVVK
jgi:stringent starvation protein B